MKLREDGVVIEFCYGTPPVNCVPGDVLDDSSMKYCIRCEKSLFSEIHEDTSSHHPIAVLWLSSQPLRPLCYHLYSCFKFPHWFTSLSKAKGLSLLKTDAMAFVKSNLLENSDKSSINPKETRKSVKRKVREESNKETADEMTIPLNSVLMSTSTGLEKNHDIHENSTQFNTDSILDSSLRNILVHSNELLEKYSNNSLRQMLRRNNQPMNGTKHELALRIAEGKSFGSLPNCPQCNRGNLKVMLLENGILQPSLLYVCAGFFELVPKKKYIACEFQATCVNNERKPWKR